MKIYSIMCLIIVSFFYVSCSTSLCNSSKNKLQNREISNQHKKLFDSLSNCLVLQSVYLHQYTCKESFVNLEDAFIEYLYRIAGNNTYDVATRLSAIHIMGVNGTEKSFNIVKSIISNDSGCIYFVSIASLDLFEDELFKKDSTISFLKEHARSTTDPRAKDMLYEIIGKHSTIDDLYFFREELNNKDQLFYFYKWDCELYFCCGSLRAEEESSLAETLWKIINSISKNDFNKNIDSIDRWVDRNRKGQ